MGAAEVAGEGAGEQAHLELVHGTGRRRFGLTHDHTAGWALVSEGRCDSFRALTLKVLDLAIRGSVRRIENVPPETTCLGAHWMLS